MKIIKKMRINALLIIIFMAGNACATTGSINMVVGQNGNVVSIIILEGAGTIEIPLPLDAANPMVKGGLYVQSDEGIEVSLAKDDIATILYKTKLLTSKQGDTWTLTAELPSLESTKILVALPPEVIIKDTTPKAGITDENESKNLIWKNQKNIKVSYTYPTTASTTLSTLAPTTTIPEEDSSIISKISNMGLLLIIVFTTLLVIIYSVYRVFIKDHMTEGMVNVMKTMSGNEYKVVDTLLKKGGGMKRSSLERSSGISKSSLAVALNTLERKGIVDVNRDNTTHYIELSKWFKGL